MIRISRTIARLISVLITAGIVNGEQALWIIEPLINKSESEVRDDKE